MRAARDGGVPFGIYLSTQEPHNKTFRGGGEERMDASVRRLCEDHPLSMMPVPPNIHDDLVGKPAYLNGYLGRGKRVGSSSMTPDRYWECQYASFTMMTVLDRVLGCLFDALEAMELRGSTYIVFMSDNGLFQGEHGLMSKGLHYEESAAAAESANRPNIVLIMTDDQGYWDTGASGNPHIDTPHMDGIASNGITRLLIGSGVVGNARECA